MTVAKAVKDKIDYEIHALDRLDLDDIDVLKEHRLQQMKKMSKKRSRWIARKLWYLTVMHFIEFLAKGRMLSKSNFDVSDKQSLLNNSSQLNAQVGFNKLGETDEFSTEKLEERLAKAQFIFSEGESSLNPSKSSAKSRSIRQSSNLHSSDSDSDS
ncbi:hypothetical protein LOK49_LG13G00792 [Camellia lanceoleosa]|uniref:Uncharacterized protein n=1 Tax=Camellia lanceoleosa TaxID=1840588 RepID=A0ACC0FIE0_9ERIC|nr:hypothetical protein LOK49_LG13G00792 [Camellia lanceoleosa]